MQTTTPIDYSSTVVTSNSNPNSTTTLENTYIDPNSTITLEGTYSDPNTAVIVDNLTEDILEEILDLDNFGTSYNNEVITTKIHNPTGVLKSGDLEVENLKVTGRLEYPDEFKSEFLSEQSVFMNKQLSEWREFEEDVEFKKRVTCKGPLVTDNLLVLGNSSVKRLNVIDQISTKQMILGSSWRFCEVNGELRIEHREQQSGLWVTKQVISI